MLHMYLIREPGTLKVKKLKQSFGPSEEIGGKQGKRQGPQRRYLYLYHQKEFL